MKLLHNENKLFYSKKELLNLKISLPFFKLDMFGSRLVSNGLILSSDTPVDI